MGKIDLSINKEGLAHNIKKAKENGIIIPTIAEMQHPETIPENIQEKLKSVGMWDVNPRQSCCRRHCGSGSRRRNSAAHSSRCCTKSPRNR